MDAIIQPKDLSSPAVRHELLPTDGEHLTKMRWDHVTLLKRSDEGASYEEMAAAVGRPIGTVKSRLHRARAMLAGLRKASALLTADPAVEAAEFFSDPTIQS